MPLRVCSIARSKPRRTSASVRRSRLTPRPWLPSSGLVEDGLGRWAEGCAVGEQDEAFQLGNEIERRIGLHQVVEEANRELAGRQAHLLLAVPVDDVVLTGRPRPAGLAPGGRTA